MKAGLLKPQQLGRMLADQSSNHLSALIEFSDDAIISMTLDGVITSWNPAAIAIFGYHSSEAVGQHIRTIMHAEQSDEEVDVLAHIASGEHVPHFETVRVRKDGTHIDVSVSISPIKDSLGVITGASKIARDISIIKQRERDISRLTCLYAALSHINQAIVFSNNRTELFHKVCHALVEHGQFYLAWIGWHNPETRQLEPVGMCGDENEYIRSIQIYADDRPEGRGPSGIAFRSGQPYICNDMLNDPATIKWRTEMKRRFFKASAAFPIRLNGEVCAVLSVYSNEQAFFQDKEIALLTEAAVDISFALENFAREAARQEAEKTLRHERDFSEAMINSLPGVLYLYDKNGKFLRWNKNFEQVTGYSADEIANMHPLDFFHADEKEVVAARIGKVFDAGISNVEAGFLSKDGSVTPYYFTGIMTELDGQSCLVGVGIDITALKHAEQEKLASEARYRTLFDYAPDGIVIADAQSNYLDANASICNMLGYSYQELTGMHASDIVAAAETRHIDPALDVIKSQSEYHREWKFRRKDGSIFPAEVIATMMPDGNLLGMIRDITDRKQAETALHELNETLEAKVSMRTNELHAALVRAEAADQIKSAFLATMSHELRTPLNSIIGFTGIILQQLAGPLNPEQRKQMEMVRTSARHLLELINDVLDLSKIEAGQLKVKFEAFDLKTSIERVVGLIRPMAEKKGLKLEIGTSLIFPEMKSDRRRIEQILINLLNNAIKFTEHGSVTLHAEIIEAPQLLSARVSAPALHLRIKDTGPGIRPEDMSRLFQPFSQLDAGLARQHEGTGLGLVICRRLVRLLGGDIFASSVWTEGSEFSVILPLRMEHYETYHPVN